MIGKIWIRRLVVVFFLLVQSNLARATVFTLDNWNTTELQTSLDIVTVIVGGDALGGFTCAANQLCIHWNDGAGTATPTVKGIIDFGYDDGNAATVAPSTTAETGGVTAWNFNGSGNADGFGVFEKNNDKGNGDENTAGTVNWLVFTLDGIPSDLTNWDFAAHVQYNDGCSGWVSDRVHPRPGSNLDCDPPPPSVPEPPTMILIGFGLIGLATWSRTRSALACGQVTSRQSSGSKGHSAKHKWRISDCEFQIANDKKTDD